MVTNISKLRDSADILLENGNYESAYGIYDEVYKLIWLELGKVQYGINTFTQNYLNNNYQSILDFRRRYTVPAVNSAFLKSFGLDIEETLNEFIFIIYGRVQCICFSQLLFSESSFISVSSEFLILHYLLLNNDGGEWINSVLKIVTPSIEELKLKKLRFNISENSLKKYLVDGAKKIKSTDWYVLNINLLEYLSRFEEKDQDFIKEIHSIIGPYSSHWKKRKSKKKTATGGQKEEYQQYEKYERYEKYEKYEKFEKESSFRQIEFDFNSATDFEKAKYFGRLFGLAGQVSKSQIRKQYIELISKYHPDKVADLGKELVELAEKKTKEINIAYEWFKLKYNI